MYAIFGAALAPSYSAAKGALVQLTKSIAIELAPFNIQVKALASGFIETDDRVRENYARATRKSLRGRQPIVGVIPTNGPAVVFLASGASDFVSGSTMVVDCGYAIR